MRFLIQKINKEIRHDFSFTLLESIRYHNWLQQNNCDIGIKYVNRKDNDDFCYFNSYHEHYVPVGSVEFVLSWMKRFDVPIPKPVNVPEELFDFANRHIFNGTEAYFSHCGKSFIKSNDKIKGTCGIFNQNEPIILPAGNYQFSEVVSIDSEWRAFVYEGKLVGLQNYSGDFTMFPNISHIEMMIKDYKSAPIAYTLDVGVFNYCDTFVIECHDFFSCGLYGFAEHKIYPYMLYRWFHEYLNKNK